VEVDCGAHKESKMLILRRKQTRTTKTTVGSKFLRRGRTWSEEGKCGPTPNATAQGEKREFNGGVKWCDMGTKLGDSKARCRTKPKKGVSTGETKPYPGSSNVFWGIPKLKTKRKVAQGR